MKWFGKDVAYGYAAELGSIPWGYCKSCSTWLVQSSSCRALVWSPALAKYLIVRRNAGELMKRNVQTSGSRFNIEF